MNKGSLPYSTRPVPRASPFVPKRSVLRFVGAGVILFLIYSYLRCSPYVCPPRSPNPLDFDTGYPRGGGRRADDTRQKSGERRHRQDSGYTGYDERPKNLHSKALVVASMKGDDTSWLDEYFSDWDRNVFVMNDPKAKLTVAKNKGRESMAYLTYLIDNYHDLPEYIVFLHALRYQWHNEDPMYDGVPPLKNLQLSYMDKVGYANMRCSWTIGCPTEIRPEKRITQVEAALEADNERANTEAAYSYAFKQLFPDKEVPDSVGVHCGAQFALSRWKVLERPKEDYIRYRDWLYNTPLKDSVSGRILEYSWHMIFGMPPITCPRAEDCFCEKFGLCNLTCPDDGYCEKRYQLPQYATIPRNWPHEGTGRDGFPAWGWWE